LKGELVLPFTVERVECLKPKPDEPFFALADYMPPEMFSANVFSSATRPKHVYTYELKLIKRTKYFVPV
jgi:hypothetical protein